MALFRWLKAVFKQWWADVTGGALVLFLALYSELSGNTVPPRIYEVAVIIAVFQAMFLAWRKEESGRIKVEKELTECRATSGARTAIREQLASHMLEAQALLSRCFKGEDLTTLETDVISWLARLEQFLGSTLGDSYIVRVRSGAGLPMYSVYPGEGPPRPRELQLHGMLMTRLARLEEFTKELPRDQQ